MCNKNGFPLVINDNVVEQFRPLVGEINEKYLKLKDLSNDELRRTVRSLKGYVVGSEDKKEALKTKLTDAYSIVKEIARRFSIGDIEVTADDKDREIAQKYDFVLIKGDKAIYKNRWLVGDVPYKWDMVHYDEQLLGGILLHYGYAIEMATGEGKTLVATLPVFLNGLAQEGVHLMTANSYLSKRDCEMTRPIYMFCGLTVDCIEFYGRHNIKRKEAYHSNITFGTTSSFTFDYLWDHLATDPKECVQVKHTYAIIDELDSILIDDAGTPHIVGGHHYYDDSESYKSNISYIRELLNAENVEELYRKDLLHHSASFTEAGCNWLREKLANPDLFKIRKVYEVNNFDSLSDEEKDKILSSIKLQNVLLQLLRALTVYEKDVDYVVTPLKRLRINTNVTEINDDGRIDIIDQNTGRLRKSRRWEYGLHTAIEVKEGVTPQPDFDGTGVISLKNFLRLYSKVAGMSGTIMAAAEELEAIYGLKCAKLPTHKPNIRIDYPLRVFKTCKDKDAAILETVVNNHRTGRPTLIGSLTLKRSDSLATLLRENGIECNKLDAKSEKDESVLVAKAGIGNTVTVSTSISGRGTDIKPSSDALANGGLMVISADMFSSVRVDQQLKGRTGRQGNPGSSVSFASLDDVVLRYLAEEDRRKLLILADRIEGKEISTPEISDFFVLAQSNREKFDRADRVKTARKDDIIAPRRKTFYDKRNEVLHNPRHASKIIEEIINNEGLPKDEIETKLRTLYSKFSLYLKREKSINPNMEELLTPFSCQRETFALSFDIRDKKYDFETFSIEYERQLILKTYDRHWGQFVLYILDNLDQSEIDRLDDKFQNMIENINHELAKLISQTTIIFNPKMLTDEPQDLPSSPNENPKKAPIVAPDALCPCGSGKKYCECHGRNTHNKSRRR